MDGWMDEWMDELIILRKEIIISGGDIYLTMLTNSHYEKSALNVVTKEMDIHDKEANEEAAQDYLRILTDI